jgi:hypothetical protein
MTPNNNPIRDRTQRTSKPSAIPKPQPTPIAYDAYECLSSVPSTQPTKRLPFLIPKRDRPILTSPSQIAIALSKPLHLKQRSRYYSQNTIACLLEL